MPDQEQTLDIDISVAHTARVWNYWLGGKDNYPADRLVGEQIRTILPQIVKSARGDRGFLVRTVSCLTGEVGIRQFLDIGTGLPTANNTHEVAQAIAPESRVVYVDNDPLIMVHARALLTSTPQGVTDYIHADLRDPDTILHEAAQTLDFSQPVALMLLGILNFIMDDDHAQAIVHRLLDAVPAGSYLAISHPTPEVHRKAVEQSLKLWNQNATPPMVVRSRRQLLCFFDRLELLDPGIVSCSRWRLGSDDLRGRAEVTQFGGLGRKP